MPDYKLILDPETKALKFVKQVEPEKNKQKWMVIIDIIAILTLICMLVALIQFICPKNDVIPVDMQQISRNPLVSVDAAPSSNPSDIHKAKKENFKKRLQETINSPDAKQIDFMDIIGVKEPNWINAQSQIFEQWNVNQTMGQFKTKIDEFLDPENQIDIIKNQRMFHQDSNSWLLPAYLFVSETQMRRELFKWLRNYETDKEAEIQLDYDTKMNVFVWISYFLYVIQIQRESALDEQDWAAFKSILTDEVYPEYRSERIFQPGFTEYFQAYFDETEQRHSSTLKTWSEAEIVYWAMEKNPYHDIKTAQQPIKLHYEFAFRGLLVPKGDGFSMDKLKYPSNMQSFSISPLGVSDVLTIEYELLCEDPYIDCNDYQVIVIMVPLDLLKFTKCTPMRFAYHMIDEETASMEKEITITPFPEYEFIDVGQGVDDPFITITDETDPSVFQTVKDEHWSESKVTPTSLEFNAHTIARDIWTNNLHNMDIKIAFIDVEKSKFDDWADWHKMVRNE